MTALARPTRAAHLAAALLACVLTVAPSLSGLGGPPNLAPGAVLLYGFEPGDLGQAGPWSVRDASPAHSDGVRSPVTTVIAGPLGHGNALRLGGGRVDVEATGAVSNRVTGDFTFTAWVHLDAVPGAMAVLVGMPIAGPSCHTSRLEWYLMPSALGLGWNDASGANHGVEVPWTPSTGTWTHLAVVGMGSTLTFYVNGQAKIPAAAPLGLDPRPLEAIAIGDHACSPDPSWTRPVPGAIDDVRIFDRGLTPLEVLLAEVCSVSDTLPDCAI